MGVYGEKEIVKMTKAANTTVVTRFESDKSPSVLATAHGHGKAVFAARAANP